MIGGSPGAALEWLATGQREDGSWGKQATAPGRIVPTIFAARSLQEAGLDDEPCLSRALDFLSRNAVVDGGGSIYGTRDSVVPCYTGMMARLLVRAGRAEAAMPLLQWIVRYQPVVYGGVVYHEPAGPLWGEYLRKRYGGCMAATTCLLGLVPAVSALTAARRAGLRVAAGQGWSPRGVTGSQSGHSACFGRPSRLPRVRCTLLAWHAPRGSRRPAAGAMMDPMVPTMVVPLPDLPLWVRGSGLEILLIILGAILLTRFATWLKAMITDRIDANDAESDALVRSEAAKHRHALADVLTWTALVIVYSVSAVQILDRLGVPTSSLVAPAAVVGVALGFGAQRLVQDLLSGFFIIAERQYGFGDLISIAGPGIPTGVIGTVEEVTLRVTKVRTANGEVIFTPNGQITQLTNLSRDWARVVIDVPVPLTVDVSHVCEILRQVGREAYADEELHPQLLDAPAVMGVQSIEVDQIHVRIVARTLPGKQFLVGLALRGRIAAALRREGIHVPVELDTGEAGGATQ